MFCALVFLQFESAKNRLWQRLKRLQRPRYLFGALAGLLYLAMMFGRTFSATNRSGVQPVLGLLPVVATSTWAFVTAFALFCGLLLAWIVPHERAALVFSEPEIAFLFPAPIRRQTLIQYKLIRSQGGVLLTVMFLTLLTRWSGGLAGALMRAAGWWVLISTINLHLLGSSFARTMLLEKGLTTWRRRALVIALTVGGSSACVFWAVQHSPAISAQDFLSLPMLAKTLRTVAQSAPATYLLAPFRWVVTPFLVSSDAHQFACAFGPALGILGLHYLWVIRADVAFEEASLEASRRHAVRLAALREGRWQNVRPARPRRDPFPLSPLGAPAVAILWKNLLSAGQMFSSRVGVALLIWATALGSGLALGASQTAWPQVLGFIVAVFAAWTVLLGPQFVRQDFRQDLAAADLLKMYPVPGWQMALGQLLAPTLILTVVEWVLILLAATLLIDARTPAGDAAMNEYGLSHAPVAVASAILVAPFNMVSLLIPNAAALLLPAWFAGPAPGSASRGIEVIGQRLIFLIAQLLALVIALVPALLAAFLVYTLIALPFLPIFLALPSAALVAACVFTLEAAGGLALLGYWFDTYDVSSEKPT